jgi:D-arabinitol dehydrogenase (NADP+)
MKAVVYEAPRTFSVQEAEKPAPQDDEILIQVKTCGICRTDMHIHNGEFLARFPMIPGHEFTGRVEAMGKDVTGFEIGDRVVADNTKLCGECYYCRRDMPLFCENFFSRGTNADGGFAEYVVVGYDKAFHFADSLTFEEASFAEPTACAVHGMDQIDVSCGDDILVFGAGPTGIILTQLLKYGGAANLVVCASSQKKLDLIEKNGYAKTVKMERGDYSVHKKELNERFPRGFDIVVDATGAPKVLEQCIDYVKPTGKIVIYGVCGKEDKISISPYAFFEKELKLIGSFAQTHCFGRAVQYLNSGIVKVDDLVTDRFALTDFDKALDTMLNGKDVLKVLVNP